MPRPRGRGGARLGAGAAVALAVLLLALGAACWALGRYLEGEAFRQLASRHLGAGLHARAELQPFRWQGSDLHMAGLEAVGEPGASFARLQVKGVQARWSWRRLWDRVCQLDGVEVEQVALELTPRPPEKAPAPERPPGPAPAGPSWLAAWVPNRVEVSSVAVREAGLRWEGGTLAGVALAGEREASSGRDAVWSLRGEGGRLEAAGWPALELEKVRLRYREPTLFLQSATLRLGAGRLTVEGEAEPEGNLQLHAEGERLPLATLLPPDWRQHLYGTLEGTAEVRGPVSAGRGPLEVSGTFRIGEGRLEALPVLNDLALFTRTAQFRQLPLSQARGRFRQKGDRLELTEVVLEAHGLAKVEGDLTFRGEEMEGTVQLGLAPFLLRWLPATRAGVFATTREGYLWTPVHLSGPWRAPREDLSARLAAGVAAEVLGTATEAAGQLREKAQGTVEGAARGVLDLIFGR